MFVAFLLAHTVAFVFFISCSVCLMSKREASWGHYVPSCTDACYFARTWAPTYADPSHHRQIVPVASYWCHTTLPFCKYCVVIALLWSWENTLVPVNTPHAAWQIPSLTTTTWTSCSLRMSGYCPFAVGFLAFLWSSESGLTGSQPRWG